MMMEYLTGALGVGVLAVLVVLVRSLTRIFERTLDGNGQHSDSPVELARILDDAINEAVKKSEDRNRKRQARLKVDELTDEELEGILEGREQKNDVET